MATRCIIAKMNNIGEGEGIVIGMDAYPEGVGRTLFENYQQDGVIDQLISRGSAPTLDSDPIYMKPYTPKAEPYKFHNSLDSLSEMFEDPDLRLRYIYVHQPNGGWLFRKWNTDWRPLLPDVVYQEPFTFDDKNR